MKALASILVALSLAGCSGLHVSWTAVASYNMPTVIQSATMHPGKVADSPEPPAAPAKPAL